MMDNHTFVIFVTCKHIQLMYLYMFINIIVYFYVIVGGKRVMLFIWVLITARLLVAFDRTHRPVDAIEWVCYTLFFFRLAPLFRPFFFSSSACLPNVFDG